MIKDEKIKKTISSMVEKIKKEYRPKKIILFGSYAWGNPTKCSDIDLFIIKDTREKPIERWMEIKKILRDPNRPIPVSPLVLTRKEVEKRKSIKDFFIKEIMEKGDVLYG